MRWQVSTGLVVFAAAVGLIAGHAMPGGGPAVAEAETKPAAKSQPSPVVVVVDHTQGAWRGVQAAIDGWSRSAYVQLRRGTSCEPQRFCIVLEEPMEYGRDWVGYRTPVSRHVSYVQLNAGDERARHARVQRQTVCHEIGHALGLRHPDGRLGRGCIVDEPFKAPARVTNFDLHLLAEVKRNGPPERSALRYIYGDGSES